MTGLTNASIAQQVQALLDQQKAQADNLTAWLGGSANGGPNLDGRYPFVDVAGNEVLVPSPARFGDMVTGPAAAADVAKVAAELARDLALTQADRADAQRALSEAARGAAIDARNLAQQHRSFAATHEANARYWAEQAQGSGEASATDRTTVEQLAEQVADDAAQASQNAQAAAASATLAATFDPSLFDMKSDTLAASRLTGMIDPARIPILVGQTPVVSTGGIAALTSGQQSGIQPGTLVATTDGRRWVYSGSGSKTAEASYIEQGDVTPVWSVIADKPPFFPSNIANVSGLQSALDGKSAVGHAHAISDVTGLQTALNAKSALNADVTFRDVIASRGDRTGVVYLGNQSQGSRYLYADASGHYSMPGGNLYIDARVFVGGQEVWSPHNFNPATKADASSWNNAGTSHVLSGVTKSFVSGVANGTIAGQAGVAALEARATDTNAGAAFMQFHRPGLYATNLGIDTDNRLKIGGWSYGSTSDHIWHNGNLPRDKWQTDTGGENRFYFGADGTTYFGAFNGASWRFRNNTNGADALTLTVGGAGTFASTLVAQGGIYTNGNEVSIRGVSPTLLLRDTDHRSAMLHVNSNRFYVLRGGGVDWSAWATVPGKGWPLEIDLETNHALFGGSIYLFSEWLRVAGDTGVVWETHGGGWFMSDSTWVRSYNNKNIYTAGQIRGGTVVGESDARLKENIARITDATGKVQALTGVTFDWKRSGSAGMGFIAQDFETVLPALVTEDTDGMKGIEYGPVVALLVEALKETNARVAALESGER